ncbi:MAG: cytochrome P450, partial [Pseudomonadota bacterium]
MILRVFTSRKSDILHYIPEGTYRNYMSKAPISYKRNIFVVNDPNIIRYMMVEKVDNYPKSDVVTASLQPLIGSSIFNVSGDIWKRQHRMIDQVFAKLRLRVAYKSMQQAFADYRKRLDGHNGETVNLDEEMAFVTADVIFRTMFSRPIADGDANTIFREFTIYQESLPHMTGTVIFRRKANSNPKIPKRGMRACNAIRDIIAKIVDERLSGKVEEEDICQIICTCEDPETGTGFSREEMIDQIAFFFLAGHETSASALTWALLCLSQDEDAGRMVREEVVEQVGSGEIGFDKLGKLKFTNAVFKEALRLYPPVSFITRYALGNDTARGYNIEPDDLVVISPWTVQRNSLFWENPDIFDPTRFLGAKAKAIVKGSWLPFGVGPRVCTGAAFATAEAGLILGSLMRDYRFTP